MEGVVHNSTISATSALPAMYEMRYSHCIDMYSRSRVYRTQIYRIGYIEQTKNLLENPM